jgi:hypothetical protein
VNKIRHDASLIFVRMAGVEIMSDAKNNAGNCAGKRASPAPQRFLFQLKLIYQVFFVIVKPQSDSRELRYLFCAGWPAIASAFPAACCGG